MQSIYTWTASPSKGSSSADTVNNLYWSRVQFDKSELLFADCLAKRIAVLGDDNPKHSHIDDESRCCLPTPETLTLLQSGALASGMPLQEDVFSQ